MEEMKQVPNTYYYEKLYDDKHLGSFTENTAVAYQLGWQDNTPVYRRSDPAFRRHHVSVLQSVPYRDARIPEAGQGADCGSAGSFAAGYLYPCHLHHTAYADEIMRFCWNRG